MHPYLRLDKIILRVCEELQADGANRSLANLACTSKFFTEPALDMLWHQVHGVEPLLRCMSRDAYKTVLNTNKIHAMNVVTFLQPTDLAVLYRYTRRVRVFTNDLSKGFENESQMTVSHVYTFFSFLCDKNAFPNLRKLHWKNDQSAAGNLIPFESLVSGGKLETLELYLGYENEPKLNFVKYMLLVCHISLRRLDIHSPYTLNIGPYMQDFSNIVRLCYNLTALKIPVISTHVLPHLAMMPNLQSLCIGEIKRHPGYHEMIRDIQTNGNLFHALTRLEIHAALEEILDILPMFRCSKLQEVVIEDTDYERRDVTVDWWKAFVYGLTTICRPETLHTLDLDFASYSEDLTFQTTIESFLYYHNMKNFAIHLHDNILLGINETQAIGRFWPYITELSITSAEPTVSSTCVDGLTNIATMCINLEKLRISFDSNSMCVSPERPTFMYGNNQITTFNVGYSMIGDRNYVCHTLESLFPFLEQMSWSNVLPREVGEDWRTIREALGCSKIEYVG